MKTLQVGKTLADIRRRRNLTQAALAKRLDVSPVTVSNYERGFRDPDAAMLTTLERILGVNPYVLAWLQASPRITARLLAKKMLDELPQT